MAVCGTFYFCSVKIAHCKYHIQTIEVRVSSKSSHPGLISMWFLILPSFLNCFLQVLSHLNIRSTMAIISLYVVPHISILFKLLNTNITFKLRSPLGIASSYSSWGNMACGSSHFSCFWSDCCKDHIQILGAVQFMHSLLSSLVFMLLSCLKFWLQISHLKLRSPMAITF